MVAVRRLAPTELAPFLEFMDGPAFKSQPQWAGCYCQFYLDDPNSVSADEISAERNRQVACDRVNAGTMQGYLAFEGERVVGWMAANKANNFAQLSRTSDSTARILCFVVDEEYQGRGVAKALLAFALEDLPSQGFDLVEAAPLASDGFVNYGYRGPKSMFLKAGFELGPMLDDKHVLVLRKLTA